MSSTLVITSAESAAESVPNARPVAYWIVTALFAIPTIVAGTFYVLHRGPFFENMVRLGYPAHLAGVLGACKVLGALGLLAPKLPRLKEWAYAGFTFNLVTALVAHVAASDPPIQLFPAAGALAALAASWWLRPASRRL